MKFLLLLFSPLCLLSQQTETLDVYYDYGRSAPADREYLNFLNKSRPGEIIVQLDGYTDTSSSAAYNEELANRRIDAIAANLATGNIIKINHGERDFDPALGMAGNRRVRITITTTQPAVSPPEKVTEKTVTYDDPVLGERLRTRIRFYNASSKMREYSLPEVDAIALYLRTHPNIRAELHGHVCCTQNTPMSLERAEAVKTALIQRGIDPARITCFGHGNTERLNNEENEAEMDENRRVEVLFLEKN